MVIGEVMKLIKCRKCGSAICTDATFQDRMLDAINELSEKARKDKRNAGSYLQQAAAVKKIMTQYLHRTSQIDTDFRRQVHEKAVLVHYLLDNGLITQEKLDELNAIAGERAKASDERDAEAIELLYGDFENIMANKTKPDPTYRKARK